jgi:hypothetical protein
MHCRKCHYTLDGISEGRCPECGTNFDPEDPDSYLDSSSSAYRAEELQNTGCTLGVLLLTQIVIALTIYPEGMLFFSAVLALPAALVLILAMRFARRRLTRTLLLLATLPGWIIISNFLFLAIHMLIELGGWPSTIGNAGFSSPLLGHAKLTGVIFFAGLALTLLAPALGVVLLFFRRTRSAGMFVAIVALSINYSLVILSMFPKGFLNWWWD